MPLNFIKLILAYVFLVIYLSGTAVHGQNVSTSCTTQEGVTLYFEISGSSFRKADIVNIKYRIENRRRQAIYLVVKEDLNTGIDISKNELALSVHKQVTSDHYFELPKLRKIKAGDSYEDTISLNLSSLKSIQFGNWSLYLVVGFLDTQGINELRDILREQPAATIARKFEPLQRLLVSAPVKIDLIP